MKAAIYPGSFDPPTLGHLDLITRAARLFDTLVVAIGANLTKKSAFSLEERLDMLRSVTKDMANVEVASFDGLLVDFARIRGVTAIVRGLRAASDFENEFQMALTNRTLAPAVEAVFLMTSADHMFVSSSIVREVSALGGDITKLVPESVAKRILAKTTREE